MTKSANRVVQDERDVMDNPEWTEADIRACRRQADFAPGLAATLERTLRPLAKQPAKKARKLTLP